MQRRELNLFDATMYVMGGIIGVGIFFNPASIAAKVPDAGWFLALWVLGGVIALAGALTSAELGGSLPRSGGFYVFLHEAWGPFVAFLFAFVALGVITTGACAVVAKVCVDNVCALVPGLGRGDSATGRAIGALLLGGVSVFAMLGAKAGAWLSNACMVLKLGAIGALIVGALVFFTPGEAAAPVVAHGEIRASAIGAALLPIFFACGGWQQVCYLAGEVREPQRTVPRAIALGVVLCIAVYLLVNWAYVRVLGVEGLAANPSGFAREVATAALGGVGGKLLTAAMAVSALGITVVLIVTTPWMFVAMAKEGLFFRSFARVHPRTGAPVLAVAALGAMCLFWWFQGSAGALVDATVFAEWIFHGLIALGLLKLRVFRKELPRPFASPLYPLAPLAYLAIAVLIVAMNTPTARTDTTFASLVVLGIGALLYAPWRWVVARAGAGAAA
ncbi:MAG: amino acid permease [Planctomycetes bacterium]|nr:amino acid permease [Planctomycetota bacterium]